MNRTHCDNEIPNLINNITKQQYDYCLEQFKYYKNEISFDKASLLIVGCKAILSVLNAILSAFPMNYTDIYISDLMTEENLDTHAMHEKFTEMYFTELNLCHNDTEDLQFDHIISFWCLRWVIHQRIAIPNILKLLTSNGSALLIFETSNGLFDVIKKTAILEKYAPYFIDILPAILPLQSNTDIVTDLENNLYNNKLNYSLVSQRCTNNYKNLNELQDAIDRNYALRPLLPKSIYSQFCGHVFYTINRENTFWRNGQDGISIPVTYCTFNVHKRTEDEF